MNSDAILAKFLCGLSVVVEFINQFLYIHVYIKIYIYIPFVLSSFANVTFVLFC